MKGKLVSSLREAVRLSGLADGMTISFHHHLRNGDGVLNTVMEVLADMNFRDLRMAASSIFPVHAPLTRHIERGTVSRLDVNYLSGPVADFVSAGHMKEPVTFRTHGGRPRAIDSGELDIDVAFIAAPSADVLGNINGTDGPSACGSMGYAVSDAIHAKCVIAITDNLVDHSLSRVSIGQNCVDYVVNIESIGDPEGIVSGTTRLTRDPVGLTIARRAASVIAHSGLLQEGFSFQTGAGGASLATAHYVSDIMRRKKIRGSFGMGGITGFFVSLLEEGLFEKLFDVQCFDLDAIRSLKQNENHREISASLYASPGEREALVNDLDVVVLGATQIDLSFNVNVHTDSSGSIIGGSGGHSDTAAGAKMSVIVAPLFRARLPVVVDRVLTVSTPGDTVDLLVTERGMAVNPARRELKERLLDAGLPVLEIEELKAIAEKLTGISRQLERDQQTVGRVEYRDGRIIDTIKKVL